MVLPIRSSSIVQPFRRNGRRRPRLFFLFVESSIHVHDREVEFGSEESLLGVGRDESLSSEVEERIHLWENEVGKGKGERREVSATTREEATKVEEVRRMKR